MIILVRHAHCLWNEQCRRHGQLDSPLTAKGRQQAVQLGRRLAEVFDHGHDFRVITSPLLRAQLTGRIIAEQLGVPVLRLEVEPRLLEVHFGDWQGLTDEEVRERFPDQWRARCADRWGYVHPGGEGYAVAEQRVREWLGEIRDREMVIAVGHHGINRIIRGAYLGLPPEATVHLKQPHEASFVLSRGRCGPLWARRSARIHEGSASAALEMQRLPHAPGGRIGLGPE